MAYYFHWSYEDILNLEHNERAKYCKEISKINKKINGEETKKNIFDVFDD